ncbi:MAG TPA: hypothetical protein VFV92_02295, partial [Candidatus Bathyarchaeia archaeon]|nr:hypothetical protein [Candidatus Bathyarchaeia archaeon]
MPERDLENLRSSYRPSKITLLLVGESPPPHKGFFYDVDAPEGTLSRNTRRSFEESFATQYLNRKEFLKDFSSKGCYLVDLFRHRGRTVYRAN